MPRTACIDVPVLPLQLLLRERPDWAGTPVAVVEEDRPQSPLLYVNEAARRLGILPGQRYATALGLARDLRAGAVSPEDVERGMKRLVEHLRRFSPEVEPAAETPGVFWLSADGLERLHPSLLAWARSVRQALDGAGFSATVVVGFTRFGTYAVARAGRGVRVFSAAAEEQQALEKVSLTRLDLEPDSRDRLRMLAVRTVGDLLRLPAGGLRQRFGEAVYRLHQRAARQLWDPLRPAPEEERHETHTLLDAPETDVSRLLFLIKRVLDALLADLARRAEALADLWLSLRLDDGRECSEHLRPAAPTLDSTQLLGLVRLRLETVQLSAGVTELRLKAGAVRVRPQPLVLSIMRASPRDREATLRALARVRAELGEEALVKARLRDGHLPGARFAWERLEVLPARTAPRPVATRMLVRRVQDKPQALPPRPRHEPDGWLLRGLEHGRVDGLRGPYVVSGGWWSRPVHREYYYAWTSRQEVLWIYYDPHQRRFFLEGEVG